MAASTITAAQRELINSLSQDDIPIKLRCAICSRLAVNAFRLPCCDQAICETCQSTLPSTCPVCEHSPVASEDCKPNKSLRTTIKVFLRTEEKKREALRLKQVQESTPITPVEILPTAIEEVSLPPTQVRVDAAVNAEPPLQETEDPTPSILDDAVQNHEAQQDIPQPSIEEIAPGQESTIGVNGTISDDDKVTADAGSGVADNNNLNDSFQAAGNGFGFNGVSGAFPGMDMSVGDFNQMQMMMAMQNGMPASGFGNFPMMGMPGMGMDPMIMQNMFMNGGFGAGGMGMSGMNPGMGMGGFDGMTSGFNNGWGGQQNWNVAQDNFTSPNAANMGHGDFGASSNTGFAPNATGFNQGNYGRANNQYNDYQSNNAGNNYAYQRGRGRGRGGYSRGSYGYGAQDAYSQPIPQQFPQNFGASQKASGTSSEAQSIPTGPKSEAENVDEFGREIRPKSELEDGAAENGTDSMPKEDGDSKVNMEGAVSNADDPLHEAHKSQDDHVALQTSSVDITRVSTAPVAPTNPSNNGGHGMGQGGYQHGYQNGGTGQTFNPVSHVKPVQVPINAPTGPKAMRENSNFRGRGGFQMAGRTSSRTNGSVNGSVAPEIDTDKRDRERTGSPSRAISRNRSIDRSGEYRERSRERSKDRRRSRSRSGSRERRHRRHRHRSSSISEDEKETQRRRERRRERRRRREEEEGRDVTSDELPADRKKDIGENHKSRSRSASLSDVKRSSHRSRREKDKHRERDPEKEEGGDRERDRDHKSSSHRHRSHRSHREDRSRSREKDKIRDREHRHRHSRQESAIPEEKTDTNVTTTMADQQPLRTMSAKSNGTNGLEIKGASIRAKGVEDIVIPTGPKSDRQRDREREREKDKSSSSRHAYRDEPHHSSRHRESESRSARDTRDSEQQRGKEPTKAVTSSAPPVRDPHTIEREARNRERLLKEAQRMAGLTAGMGDRKRSRDEGDDRKGRKKGRRSGHLVDEEDEEARIARLEAERESARWD